MFQLLDPGHQKIVETYQCGKKLCTFYDGNQNKAGVRVDI